MKQEQTYLLSQEERSVKIKEALVLLAGLKAKAESLQKSAKEQPNLRHTYLASAIMDLALAKAELAKLEAEQREARRRQKKVGSAGGK